MKAILTLVSISVFTFLTSQENKTIAKITYEETITTPMSSNTTQYLLLFNENSSIYEEVIEDENAVSSTKIEEKQVSKGKQINITHARKKGLKIFFYNRANTDFYHQSIHNGEYTLLTKEEGNKINWKIQEEFKDISGFKCQKAMGFFRGINYTAWFTSEISVPFGPWKLHGTPGLILEAYDADQMIYVVAKHISLNNSDDIAFSDKIKEIDLTKAISMEEKRKKEKELAQEFFDRISASLPKGTKPLKVAENCEGCPKPLEIFD